MILEFARAHFWPLFWTGSGILAAVIAFTIWYVLTEPAHDTDEWEDGWQIEPSTDLDAATMAAEWHGDLAVMAASPWPQQRSMAEFHAVREHRERLAPADIAAQLRDDPALIEWDLACQVEQLRQHEIAARCQVTEIRRIRGEWRAQMKELAAA